MATKKDYLTFILDQLSLLEGISHRAMMGEYMIYYHGKLAACLCDDQMLVKPVPAALRLMPGAKWAAPYPGAKKMLLVENVEDRAFLKGLFEAMAPELPEPKKKRT